MHADKFVVQGQGRLVWGVQGHQTVDVAFSPRDAR
jgi:hypothetical protein